MRDWVTNVADTHYLLGSALGAHPYPMMVRDFHRVIGEEARAQILEAEGRLPDTRARLRRRRQQRHRRCSTRSSRMTGVKLIGVEAGGRGGKLGEHAARFRGGAPGVSARGATAICCRTRTARYRLTHSVSAGLDYAMVGPEHAWLHDRGRAEYVSATDAEALAAAQMLCAHGGHHSGARIGARRGRSDPARAGARRARSFIVNLSGRGDKDIDIYRENFTELDVRNDPHRPPVRTAEARRDRQGLIAYLTAGDPSPDRTPALVAALERGGADLIELGVPFSDPIADGPVIQRAGERALQGRHDAARVLEIAARDPQRIRRFRCCCSPI